MPDLRDVDAVFPEHLLIIGRVRLQIGQRLMHQLFLVFLDLNDLGGDDVKVRVGVPDPDPDKDARLVAALKNTFRAKIRVAPAIEVCRADLLARDVYKESSRKPLKVVDLRPKN